MGMFAGLRDPSGQRVGRCGLKTQVHHIALHLELGVGGQILGVRLQSCDGLGSADRR